MSRKTTPDHVPDAGKMVEAGELREIPLVAIVPSSHNPRKTFDEAELARLADSIRESGVLQPIVVRPRFSTEAKASAARNGIQISGDLFEIVAGERRVRASKLAGKATIPALVRDLDDRAAAVAQVTENDQRVDVPPLEQAEGYQRLIELGDTLLDIAVRTGRDLRYIQGRLQLRELIPELQKDLEAGKLPLGHAWILCRLQPAAQKELRKFLYDTYGWRKDQVCTLGELRSRISRTALFVLSAAPWKWDDATLLPEAGSCKDCPKRSGNNPTLFDELVAEGKKKPPETCTDGACFLRKREAFLARKAKELAEKIGQQPVRVSASYSADEKGVLGYGDYVKVSPKEAQKLKPEEIKTAIVVEGHGADGQDIGKVIRIRLKKDMPSSPIRDRWQVEQAKARKRAEAGKLAAQLAAGQVCARVEAQLSGTISIGQPFTAMLQQITAAYADYVGADACRLVTKRRGLVKDEKKTRNEGRYIGNREPVETLALQLDTVKELLGLIAELTAARRAQYWGTTYSGSPDKEELAFWKTFGVVKADLVKKVEAERKAKRDEKKAAKKVKANKTAAPKKAKREKKAKAAEADEEDGAFARPGDVVRTSYGTGPYVVKSIQRSGRRKGRAEYSLICTDAAKNGKGNPAPGYLNGYQRQPDGRILAISGDMLIVLPAGSDPGPTYWDWLKAAGLDTGEDNGNEDLQLAWMRGEPAPAKAAKTWRDIPVQEAVSCTGTLKGKFHLAGIATLGQLDLALRQGRGFDLRPADLEDLREEVGLAVVAAGGPEGKPMPGMLRCRVCGCTRDDCQACIEKTGRACHWVEADLCSACVPA